jgi:hypothetical protein
MSRSFGGFENRYWGEGVRFSPNSEIPEGRVRN